MFWASSASWLGPLLNFFGGLMLMLIIGNPMIAWLQQKRWKKGTTLDETWTVREDTPDTHQKKQGTPSMGGIGIIAAALLTFLALTILAYGLMRIARQIAFGFNSQILLSTGLVLCVSLFHALLGFTDDWSKASGRGGLRARTKLAGQIFLALAFVGALAILIANQSPRFPLYNFPVLSIASIGPTFLFAVAFLMLVVIASGNAVNLTDGIDGLAAGLAVQCGLAFYLCGSNEFAVGQTNILYWAALAGACLGFLNFNRHPARVFMGDTGSLAIGAALGAGAILQHAVFLLPFIGFIYFVEAASVTLQVLWFKWTKRQSGEGKRLFRRAPLHHHFELGGWSEWRVVGTFWLVNLFTSAIGLWLWRAGVLPRWP